MIGMSGKREQYVIKIVEVLPADLPSGDFSPKGFRKLDTRKTCLDCGYLHYLRIRQVDVTEEGNPVFEREEDLINTANRNEILRGGSNQSSAKDLECFRGVWSVTFSDDKRKMVEKGLKQATKKRRCPLFFPYSAGDSPETHRELHRERTVRHTILFAGMIGAVIGGILSLAGTLLFWYLSSQVGK